MIVSPSPLLLAVITSFQFFLMNWITSILLLFTSKIGRSFFPCIVKQGVFSKALMVFSITVGAGSGIQELFTCNFWLKSLSLSSLSNFANLSRTKYCSHLKSIGFTSFCFSATPCPTSSPSVSNNLSLTRLLLLHRLCNYKLSGFRGMLLGSICWRKCSKLSRELHCGSL